VSLEVVDVEAVDEGVVDDGEVAGVVESAVVAVLVRVDLLQPVNASPTTKVVNKSVFFIGRYELLGD
jgi:hypothetical protein